MSTTTTLGMITPQTITLLTPEAIRQRLAGLSVTAITVATGLHSNTVYRWRRGEMKDPTLHGGWKVLSDWLTARELNG